jgi:hypothetical protein
MKWFGLPGERLHYMLTSWSGMLEVVNQWVRHERAVEFVNTTGY